MNGANMNIGRNDPCPCQSGKKYKKCCLLKIEELQQLENSEWEQWFKTDVAKGEKNVTAYEEKLPKTQFDS